jgi:hypothetical protein
MSTNTFSDPGRRKINWNCMRSHCILKKLWRALIYFCVFLKDRVFSSSPQTIPELKARIREIVQGIPQNMLVKVGESLANSVQQYIDENVGHLHDVIF